MIKIATFKEDEHEHIIFKYHNGLYYIHLHYNEQCNMCATTAGGYTTYKDAAFMMKKFRPFSKLLIKHIGTFEE